MSIKTDIVDLSKDQNKGITVAGGHGWGDIIGKVVPDPLGANAPSTANFIGSVRGWQYGLGDKVDCVFHIPHDYAPGTDLYIHLHWGHNAASISGNFVADMNLTYASREASGPFSTFSAEITPNITVSSLDITNYPQYCHVVSEIQLSAASPSATQLDSDDIEVDGLVLVTFTYNGTMSADPFIFTGDIHYQSTGIGTANKDPDFYA